MATGILSEGEIAPPIRQVLRKQKNVRVFLGEVEAIDRGAQTVTSNQFGMQTVTPFDSLIVSAGAQQSCFGNDQFATCAPGMKTIDHALEVRGRILGAFEAAEITVDPAQRQRRLTFVGVGAGPTGVELAGQIAELANRALAGAFQAVRPRDCRVILVDASPAVLAPMGGEARAQDAAATGKAGRRDPTRRDGDRCRPPGNHRAAQGRHDAAHRMRVQSVDSRRYKNRFTTVIAWLISFLGRSRGQLTITNQMIYARRAMNAEQAGRGTA